MLVDGLMRAHVQTIDGSGVTKILDETEIVLFEHGSERERHTIDRGQLSFEWATPVPVLGL